MTVISVNELNARGGFDREGNREYEVTYKVLTNARSDGPIQVLTDVLSPAYGTTYEFGFGLEEDLGAYRQNASCQLMSEEDSNKVWLLTITYSSRPVFRPDQSLFGGGTGTNDPTTITKISGSFLPFRAVITQDVNGVPVVNAAGDPFDDSVVDWNRPTLNIEKTYNAATFATLIQELIVDVSLGKVNDATFWYADAHKWKLNTAPWEEALYGETKYYQVKYTFEMNQRTWKFKPPNRGHRYISGTQYLRFSDDKGLDYGGDGLGPLEDDGTRRASGADPAVIYFDGSAQGAGDPFELYETKDFTAAPYSLPSTL